VLADYRRLPRALSKVYYHPIEDHKAEFAKLFDSLASNDRNDPPVDNRILTIWGRKLRVPRSSSKVAWFTFKDLCDMPLSAADYLEITRSFETVFIADCPTLAFHQRAQVGSNLPLSDEELLKARKARRFILFIDAAYESKVPGWRF
jgi:protein AFG1